MQQHSLFFVMGDLFKTTSQQLMFASLKNFDKCLLETQSTLKLFAVKHMKYDCNHSFG